MHRQATQLAVIAGVVATLAAWVPSQAAAATQIGETFDPTGTCEGGYTYIQNSSPGNLYEAPSDGVITSWSMRGGVPQTTSRLKVVRRIAQGVFQIVGEGDVVSAAAGTVVTSPTRIPARAGDIIGIYSVSGRCFRMAGGYSYASLAGDPPVGTTQTFSVVASPLQFDVAANLEPDTDQDGFGDETQDCAPNDPNRAEDCVSPTAAITGGPKLKTRKKQATFTFTGTDARAVASFECSLNGAPFASCTSPHGVKGKKGKNFFAVRAKDAAGNVDATPASFGWKVKRKKRK